MKKKGYLFVMLKETTIKIINNYLKNKVFNTEVPLYLNGPLMDFDYKFQIVDYTKKIYIGEWKDYLRVSVDIIKTNNYLAEVTFNTIKERIPESEMGEQLTKHFFYLRNGLENNILYNLNALDPEIEHVEIVKFNIDVDNNKPINESDMSRIAIRTVVKDITKVLKKLKKGEFYLPEDINSDNHIYTFENSPVKFQVELNLKHDKSLDGYMIDADFYNEDDVIEIKITYNPDKLKKNLYNIIGELNEIIGHELEHARQSITEGFRKSNRLVVDPFKYYSQPQEILAQKAGFRRLSKLRRIPMENVVREWFETHKDIHTLTEKKQEIIIKKILGG